MVHGSPAWVVAEAALQGTASLLASPAILRGEAGAMANDGGGSGGHWWLMGGSLAGSLL